MPTSVNLGDIAEVITEQNEFASVLSLSCEDRENWCKINRATLASCRDPKFKAEHIKRCMVEHASDMYDTLEPHFMVIPDRRFYFSDMYALFRTNRLWLNLAGDLTLPPEIKFLKALRNLTVHRQFGSRNEYRLEIPPEIGQLVELQNLSVWACNMSSLPEEVAFLSQLRALNLSSNPLNKFPMGITKIVSLTNLTLTNCGLKTIPAQMADLANLEELVLSKNELTEFPFAITELFGLTTQVLQTREVTDFARNL
jgi:hypothetical protein